MWALAVALAVAAAAVVQEAPFVLIAEPESGNIVYGHRPDDRNRHVVRVVLHFYDLHLISPEERAGLSVWFRIDRGQTVTLGPPLPASELEMSMRLGTHVIEVALRRDADIENDDDDVAIPRGVDPARVAVTVFDVMPEPGQEILRSRESPEAHLDRWWRPRADAYDYDRCLQSPMHVVLVGSLSLGGQAMLALEQARRLPGLRLSDGRPAFRLTYATSAPEGRPEPLRARLEALGVPVVRYAARIPYELACDLDGAPADNIGKRLATYASRDALPPALEAVVGKLLDIFMTADVVSFTNHETYTSADALIVECARLARVPHVLNEPANLWWGDLPTGTRKGGNGTLLAGLILPSEFAAQFWARRGVTVPLFVINPGVDVRRDDQVIAPRRRSRAFDNAMGTVVRVAFVGRLAPQKSPGLFVRAAASITALYSRHAPRKTSPRVRFVVIGDGPLRAAMEELARMLGLSVGSSDDADIEFLGWLPPEDVREAIRNYTDIVVHTNVLEETFCMCNIEAMAEDRYVISFGVGGVSEYLVQGDHHGTVVETPSVPALVAAIINVLENPNRAAAAGVMAARRVRGLDDGIDLSFERMARQYANLYAAFACQHSRQANHDGQEVETKRSSVSTPDTFADILNTLRKTHQVACLEHNRTGKDFGDPGVFLEAGRYWEGACSLTRHIAFDMRGRHGDTPNLLLPRDVDSLHALSLSLAVASGVFVKSEVPQGDTRAAWALSTLAAIAEAGLLAARKLVLSSKIPELARIAATARATRGGTPNTAAALFHEVVMQRRGGHQLRNAPRVEDEAASNADLLLEFLSDVDPTGDAAQHRSGVSVGVNDGGWRVVELKLADPASANGAPRRLMYTSSSKLHHDARQFSYLATTHVPPSETARSTAAKAFRLLENFPNVTSRGLADDDLTDESLFASLARAYEHVADLFDIHLPDSNDLVSLVSFRQLVEILNATASIDPELVVVMATYGRLLHVELPPSLAPLPALDHGWQPDRIADAFFSNEGIAVIDNALNQNALDALRSQLLKSTIWFDIKRGHLGAYLEDGLASGLLLQIAEEFQTRLSRIVRHKRLVQAWAYKYLYNGDKGIRPHADEGTVTINCWLTPDAENLDDTSGGLRVYLSETPSNFSFATANQDFRRVMAALGDAPFLDVPHRQNRCLVFKSRLVHETQPLNFRRTYESSRINLSLMYGSTSWQA